MATGPAVGTVFVTRESYAPTTGGDYATIAYNANTGAQRWVKRYDGTGNDNDVARRITVSPSGGTLFVTGDSVGSSYGDYATIGYSG